MKDHLSCIRLSIALVLTLFLASPNMALALDLCDTSSAGKAFFDIDTTNLDNHSLPFVLGGIKVTFDELAAQDVTPDFIVTFRGLNTGLLSNEKATDDVKFMIETLEDMGITIEVCIKAVMLSGENPDDVLTNITIIENAWVSSILNQNLRKGYAYITF